MSVSSLTYASAEKTGTEAGGASERQHPRHVAPRALSALARHVSLTVPWATLLAGCATGTVVLATLGMTSRTPLDQGTVRLTFLPTVVALAFVVRTPTRALAQAAPVPTWVAPAAQTLLAAPAVAITCWAQLLIMASTFPAHAGHPPAIYPLVAELTGWCAIGVAVAAACDRSRYSDLGGAIAGPLALVAIVVASVTPCLKDLLAFPPAMPETATIAWYIFATGALAVAVAAMRDRWHRYGWPRARPCTAMGLGCPSSH